MTKGNVARIMGGARFKPSTAIYMSGKGSKNPTTGAEAACGCDASVIHAGTSTASDA